MTFSLFLHMFDFLFSLETSAFLPPTILTSIWIFKGNGSYLAYSGLWSLTGSLKASFLSGLQTSFSICFDFAQPT